MDAEKDAHVGEFVPGVEGSSTRMRNIFILKKIPAALQALKEAAKDYTVIRRSIYVDRKPKALSEEDIYVCDCVKSSSASLEQLSDPNVSLDCKEKCINRKICTECEVKSCPCGELCNNRQFQLQQDRCVYPFRAGEKGWGLRTAEHISAGSFIIQYLGEIFSIKGESGQQRISQFANKTCTYLMRISAKEVIDPSAKGNIARFINHSCNPNCVTQKWHVLGEVAVGIFALKDLHSGEELTFDYKFDVYRTPFMACLCREANCRGFLGLMETETLRNDETEAKQDLLCEMCKVQIAAGEEPLVCDSCSGAFHADCLKSSTGSSEKWLCAECEGERSFITVNPGPFLESSNCAVSPSSESATKETLRSRKKTHFKETCEVALEVFSQDLLRSEFEKFSEKSEFREELARPGDLMSSKMLLSPVELSVFREHVLKLTSVSSLRVFWNFNESSCHNFFAKSVELNLLGTNAQSEVVGRLLRLVESSVKKVRDSTGLTENSFRVPAIFLRRAIGEHLQVLRSLERDLGVKISFNKAHLSEDVYPLYFLTLITLKGRAESVRKAHTAMRERIEGVVVRRQYMNRADIKVVSNRLSFIRKEIFPAEVRYSKDNALRDINHPFYTIYYKDKEVALIGSLEEVMRAEKLIAKVIEQSRYKEENTLSLNYLIPVCNKSQLINIKNRIERRYPGSKMIIYDPLHPRKNVSLTLCSSYREFDAYFQEVKHYLDTQKLYQGLFENYQRQMLYQMSKYFFKYLQNFKQTKSIVFMKAWDTISAEFDEHSLLYPSTYSLLQNKIIHDYEFRFYVTRVNNLYKGEQMALWDLNKKEFLTILALTLKKKNEQGLYAVNSIFFDVETGKAPADYDNFVSCLDSLNFEETDNKRAEASHRRAAEVSVYNSSQQRDTSLLKLRKRPSAEHSLSLTVSPAHAFQREEIREISLAAVKLEKTALATFPNRFAEKSVVRKESLSSPEISIHYRDNLHYKKTQRNKEGAINKDLQTAKSRKVDSKFSSSLTSFSSSISDTDDRNFPSDQTNRRANIGPSYVSYARNHLKKIQKTQRRNPYYKEGSYRRYGIKRNK